MKTNRHVPAVLAIQHVRCETPGKIGEVLRAEGISTKIVRIVEENKVPDELGEAPASSLWVARWGSTN